MRRKINAKQFTAILLAAATLATATPTTVLAGENDAQENKVEASLISECEEETDENSSETETAEEEEAKSEESEAEPEAAEDDDESAVRPETCETEDSTLIEDESAAETNIETEDAEETSKETTEEETSSGLKTSIDDIIYATTAKEVEPTDIVAEYAAKGLKAAIGWASGKIPFVGEYVKTGLGSLVDYIMGTGTQESDSDRLQRQISNSLEQTLKAINSARNQIISEINNHADLADRMNANKAALDQAYSLLGMQKNTTAYIMAATAITGMCGRDLDETDITIFNTAMQNVYNTKVDGSATIKNTYIQNLIDYGNLLLKTGVDYTNNTNYDAFSNCFTICKSMAFMNTDTLDTRYNTNNVLMSAYEYSYKIMKVAIEYDIQNNSTILDTVEKAIEELKSCLEDSSLTESERSIVTHNLSSYRITKNYAECAITAAENQLSDLVNQHTELAGIYEKVEGALETEIAEYNSEDRIGICYWMDDTKMKLNVKSLETDNILANRVKEVESCLDTKDVFNLFAADLTLKPQYVMPNMWVLNSYFRQEDKKLNEGTQDESSYANSLEKSDYDKLANTLIEKNSEETVYSSLIKYLTIDGKPAADVIKEDTDYVNLGLYCDGKYILATTLDLKKDGATLSRVVSYFPPNGDMRENATSIVRLNLYHVQCGEAHADFLDYGINKDLKMMDVDVSKRIDETKKDPEGYKLLFVEKVDS